MSDLFVVTSAINTRFGAFNAEERLEQTRQTVASIRRRAPSAHVCLVEMAAIALEPGQRDELRSLVDTLMEYGSLPAVSEIYHGTESWDVVKNATEVLCLRTFLQDYGQILQERAFDRIFKLSGRYVLGDAFQTVDYAGLRERIVFARRRPSQFPIELTGGIAEQYMSRLWSWPGPLTLTITEVYGRCLTHMFERFRSGGYCDIEHALFRFMPAALVSEVDQIGVSGRLGPNGRSVED